MPCNDSNFHASTSRANGPTTMPRQQQRRPGWFFAPVVKQRAEQPTERVRGGCLLCPGGGIWTFACGSSVDDIHIREQAQQVPPGSIEPPVLQASQQQEPPSSLELQVDETGQAQQGQTQVRFSGLSPAPPSSSPHQPPQSTRLRSTPSRLSDRTAVESIYSFLSMKSPRSLWQRLRERISSRPHGTNEASRPQQNSLRSVPIHPIPLCKYELKIEWKERPTQTETR